MSLTHNPSQRREDRHTGETPLTGDPTLDNLLAATIADPSDAHLSILLDYLAEHPEPAIHALRLLMADAADLGSVERAISRANRTLRLYTDHEDALEHGLPRLIREAKETDRLRQAVANLLGEGTQS